MELSWKFIESEANLFSTLAEQFRRFTVWLQLVICTSSFNAVFW